MEKNKFVIRKAETKDAKGIARVQVETWRSAYKGIIADVVLDNMDVVAKETRWKSNLKGNDFDVNTIVGVFEEEVVAFASYGQQRDGPESGYGELWAIYVLTQFSGLGFGKNIWNYYAEERKKYSKGSVVWVLEKNISAISFYRKIGFRKDGAHKYFRVEGKEYPEIRMFMK